MATENAPSGSQHSYCYRAQLLLFTLITRAIMPGGRGSDVGAYSNHVLTCRMFTPRHRLNLYGSITLDAMVYMSTQHLTNTVHLLLWLCVCSRLGRMASVQQGYHSFVFGLSLLTS